MSFESESEKEEERKKERKKGKKKKDGGGGDDDRIPYREKAARNAGRIGGDKSRWNLIGVPPPFDFALTLLQSRRSAFSVTLTLHSE